jgi:50S ribosomal protein L16 3-hydroxylase
MPPARFLRDYWQKRPLLIRGAFAPFREPLRPNDLAGIAGEATALARLIRYDPRRDRWQVRHGPFRAADFARLPRSHWTLLVQDVDKWDSDVAALLDAFRFLPSWRIDDVMVSYAVDGGGVGPHLDQYDVFLVQGRGRRRWRIGVAGSAANAVRDDTELKLLRGFAPIAEWLLEPGDMLYLPPGVPHEGVAVGTCMTYSIGMRAPSQAELLLDLAEYLAEPLGEDRRYSDPDLGQARCPGEIDAAALARVRRAIRPCRLTDDAALVHWFGSFITRYRSALEAAPRPRPLSVETVTRRLRGATLVRYPWSRVAWTQIGSEALLFVAGQAWPCAPAMAETLCAQRVVDGADLARHCRTRASHALLTALVNAGHWRLTARRSGSRLQCTAS